MGNGDDDQPDRDAIMKRRNRFVALALSGLATGAIGCSDPSPVPCLEPTLEDAATADAAPGDSGTMDARMAMDASSRPDAAGDDAAVPGDATTPSDSGSPADASSPQDSGAPMPCLTPAVCLSIAPIDAGDDDAGA